MVSNKIDKLAENVRSFLSTAAGTEQLHQALNETRQMSIELQKMRELKPETLHEPVTL